MNTKSLALVLKPFEFTANSKLLETSIQKCTAALGASWASSKAFIFLASKSKEVYLSALGADGISILIQLKGVKANQEGAFSFTPGSMLGVIKNRGDMVISATKTQDCEFKSVKGKYSGKFQLLPITDDVVSLFETTFNIAKEKESQSLEIQPDLLQSLKDGLALTSVKDVFNENSLLYSYIELNKGSLTISCFDNHHFGLYKHKVKYKGDNTKITAPLQHFQLVERLATEADKSVEKVLFTLRKRSLVAESNSFFVVLPLTQSDPKNFNLIPDFLAGLKKPDFLAELNCATLSNIVDNIFTIYDANTSISFEYKGKQELKLTSSTNIGEASDVLKVHSKNDNSIVVKTEPKVLKDLLSLVKLQDLCSFRIYKGKCITIQLVTKSEAEVTYVCSLV
jgi:hypothetical protein